MGGFVVPVIRVVIAILDIYWYLVIIQAVISWLIAFNVINTYSRPVAMVLDFLYRITEPLLRPIRQFVPSFGGLDVSPIILLLVIWLVEMELTHLAFYLYAY
ncbi:MAG TPA: YggT family protein [Stellaceae bacterium]|jgi:YggT family protein|nr:YggT family protein [Stellaceae bacterium]